MRKIINFIKTIQYNNIFYSFIGLDILCSILYYYLSLDLEKPAGIIETIKFLMGNPGGYTGSLLVGILAWLSFVIVLLSLICEIPSIKELTKGEYNYYDTYNSDEVSRNKLIINIVLGFAMFIINIIVLRFLSELFLLLIIIIACIGIYIWLSKNQ